MYLEIQSFLPLDRLDPILAMPFAELWLVAAILSLTASLYATGVPGALLPISFSSGALLGGTLGMLSVICGALAGSLVLYAVLERTPIATMRRKYGSRLKRLEGLASTKGILPLIGLRLAGMPHIAVTAVCALAAIGPRRYAMTTLVGLFPAIALSATAGAAL